MWGWPFLSSAMELVHAERCALARLLLTDAKLWLLEAGLLAVLWLEV